MNVLAFVLFFIFSYLVPSAFVVVFVEKNIKLFRGC